MVEKKIGEVALLEEAVELCLRDLYPLILEAHKIDAVDRPEVRIKKLAPGNPAEISITTPVYPEVTLPEDWKTIAGTIELETIPEILDAEVDEALLSIRRARAKDASRDADGETAENKADAEVPDDKLPVLDDTFAQSLGQFADLADLKVKLRDNMKGEKEQKARDKRRGEILEAFLAKVDVAVPAVFVDSELEKILGQLKDDISRFGLSYEDYLKRMGKTEEQIRDDFRDQARKRATLQLALNKLAAQEKVQADTSAVETEMKHALEHFPDARPELVRVHIETVLRNEKTLRLLEGVPLEDATDHTGHDHDHAGHSHE